MSDIKPLPLSFDFETVTILRKTAEAHRYLAELKGIAASIPNQHILIDTLSLQEARESSAIENIISTLDDIFQSNWNAKIFVSPAAKEVHAYAKALNKGVDLVKKYHLITNNYIIEIQSIIENSNTGFRKLPGTKLINEATGTIVFEPPQHYDTIVSLMNNLETFINDDTVLPIDPLIKMAIIHHQFESIHPFYDGNGKTGRIINILYLIKNNLLSLPILYLSRYIIQHKGDYYKLLQETRISNQWEPWVLFILEAIVQTAKETIKVITNINETINSHTNTLKDKASKIYSQDLINNLFRYPYTKIEYLMEDLKISRNTTIRYLEKLIQLRLIEKKKVGRNNFYINTELLIILKRER